MRGMGLCIPTTDQQNSVQAAHLLTTNGASTQVPAGTIGLQAWSVAFEHDTSGLGIWRGFDGDSNTLGCSSNYNIGAGDPTKRYASFTIALNDETNYTNGVNAMAVSNVLFYLEDYASPSYVTPFEVWVGNGTNVRTTRCSGAFGGNSILPGGGTYVADCPITHRTYYHCNIRTSFRNAGCSNCLPLCNRSSLLRVSHALNTHPPRGNAVGRFSTNLCSRPIGASRILGVSGTIRQQHSVSPRYEQIKSREVCQEALKRVEMHLFDATSFSPVTTFQLDATL